MILRLEPAMVSIGCLIIIVVPLVLSFQEVCGYENQPGSGIQLCYRTNNNILRIRKFKSIIRLIKRLISFLYSFMGMSFCPLKLKLLDCIHEVQIPRHFYEHPYKCVCDKSVYKHKYWLHM